MPGHCGWEQRVHNQQYQGPDQATSQQGPFCFLRRFHFFLRIEVVRCLGEWATFFKKASHHEDIRRGNHLPKARNRWKVWASWPTMFILLQETKEEVLTDLFVAWGRLANRKANLSDVAIGFKKRILYPQKEPLVKRNVNQKTCNRIKYIIHHHSLESWFCEQQHPLLVSWTSEEGFAANLTDLTGWESKFPVRRENCEAFSLA